MESPLCWAVSVGRDSEMKVVDEMEGKTFGVSRCYAWLFIW